MNQFKAALLVQLSNGVSFARWIELPIPPFPGLIIEVSLGKFQQWFTIEQVRCADLQRDGRIDLKAKQLSYEETNELFDDFTADPAWVR